MRIHTHLPTLLGSSLLLVLLGGCNSDDTGASDTLILDPSPDACASPHTILFGEMYECSGVRKARIDGAVVPLFVRNHETVALKLTHGALALEQARFNLFAGATAELRIGSTSCDES